MTSKDDHKAPHAPQPPPPQRPTPQPPPPPPPHEAQQAVKPSPDLPPKPPDNYPEPKDQKLAPPGSKDYVAGQPADEAEQAKTEAEAHAKAEPGKETHSPHYGDKK